jgi:transcriptional regulator with XRE-family HTH domain
MELTLPKRFGASLRGAREQRDMSQAEIGRLAGISPTAVCRLEAGRREPRLGTIISLATAMDMDASDLIRDIR